MSITWQEAAAILEDMEWTLICETETCRKYHNSSKVNSILILEKGAGYDFNSLLKLFSQHRIDSVKLLIAWKRLRG